MSLPLTVLVTRPSPQGEHLCELIEAQGNHAIHFPVIEFEAPQNVDGYHQALEQIAEQEWLIFISPHAVYACIPELRRRWPHLPASVKFAAVGGGTAQALMNAGYHPTLWPEQEWNSEGLLELSAFRDVKDVKIAVVRGEGGREYIDRTLVERGAKLLPIIAYRRVMPVVDSTDTLQMLQESSLDAIVCTSGEAVNHLKLLCGEQGWPFIRDVCVIVMSNRVKLLADNLGYQQVCVTTNASNDAILDIVARIRNQT